MTSQSFPVSWFWSRGFAPHRKSVKFHVFGTSKLAIKHFFAILISTLWRFYRANKRNLSYWLWSQWNLSCSGTRYSSPGYCRQLVHSIFFAIGMPTLVKWALSLFLSFCLIFSNFPRQREITLVSSSPCCNLKWK